MARHFISTDAGAPRSDLANIIRRVAAVPGGCREPAPRDNRLVRLLRCLTLPVHAHGAGAGVGGAMAGNLAVELGEQRRAAGEFHCANGDERGILGSDRALGSRQFAVTTDIRHASNACNTNGTIAKRSMSFSSTAWICGCRCVLEDLNRLEKSIRGSSTAMRGCRSSEWRTELFEVVTVRDDDTCRIISARKVTRHEQAKRRALGVSSRSASPCAASSVCPVPNAAALRVRTTMPMTSTTDRVHASSRVLPGPCGRSLQHRKMRRAPTG